LVVEEEQIEILVQTEEMVVVVEEVQQTEEVSAEQDHKVIMVGLITAVLEPEVEEVWALLVIMEMVMPVELVVLV
jgi:hypothetical protein